MMFFYPAESRRRLCWTISCVLTSAGNPIRDMALIDKIYYTISQMEYNTQSHSTGQLKSGKSFTANRLVRIE